MPRQCQFPVQLSDNRRCYRASSTPGFVISLALVAALAGYAGLSHAAPPAPKIAATSNFVGWAQGRLLVAPRAGLSALEFDKILKSINARSQAHLKKLNIHIVSLPAGVSEVAMLQALKANRKLKYVELDMVVNHAASVSDPSFSSSWALPKIQAPTAWDNANGSGITIAILDTGVDGTHPDLAANMVPGWNTYDNNADTADVYGHGTSVSGTAAMVANNGAGSAGVAWGAKIMPVRISSLDGYGYYSTISQGLTWAADNGARVANISYGVSGSAAVQSAAEYFRSKGGVVAVSAGNSGVQEPIVANDMLLTIAATDSNDARPSWSSFGSYVDLAAPGVSIYAPTRGGAYAYVSGTSFSSPITAGTIALMMSANNKLTPADVDRILKSTATDLGTGGYDGYYGAGRIDAAKAVAAARSLTAADTQAPVISITSPTGGKVTSIVPVDVSYTDNVGVTRAELYVNGNKVATDDVGPFAFVWDTAAYADGAYTLSARAYDAAGNMGSSVGVSVTIGNDTVAPVISSFNLVDGMNISPSKQIISATATDNQKVAKMSLSIDGKEVAIAYGSSISYNWNTRKLAKGPHSVTLRVWDAGGNIVTKTVTIYK